MPITDIYAKLCEPFALDELEWRAGSTNHDKTSAMALIYVTNRAIMNRLDEAFGHTGWKNEYQRWGTKGVLCGISAHITVEGRYSEWVTKWDGADETDIESTKGGLSDAMKRAAVQWGIGRYLYRMPDLWGPGKPGSNGKGFYFNRDWTPNIPAEFLPKGAKAAPSPAAARAPVKAPATPAATPAAAQPRPAPSQEAQGAGPVADLNVTGAPWDNRWPIPPDLLPAWVGDKLGVGTGGGFPAFAKRPAREFTWVEMLEGARDGSRVKYMRWAIDKAERDLGKGVRPSDAETQFIARTKTIVAIIDTGSPF